DPRAPDRLPAAAAPGTARAGHPALLAGPAPRPGCRPDCRQHGPGSGPAARPASVRGAATSSGAVGLACRRRILRLRGVWIVWIELRVAAVTPQLGPTLGGSAGDHAKLVGHCARGLAVATAKLGGGFAQPFIGLVEPVLAHAALVLGL